MSIMDFQNLLKTKGCLMGDRTVRRRKEIMMGQIRLRMESSPHLDSGFINYNREVYKDLKLSQPLYQGSQHTLLDSLFRHFANFSANNGMSKGALSMCLLNEKKVLPQPNCLPSSYKEAHRLIKPMLIETKSYHACTKDCLLFINQYAEDDNCSQCGEDRYLKDSTVARKTFTYMPIGPRLSRMYGTENICKLLYSRPDVSNGRLTDITDGKMYKSWYEEGGVFENTEEECTVPLALFCDGLNPNKSMATQKSMWPLLLTWLNLPIDVRNMLGPMMMVGIIPGTKTEEPKHLDPYLNIMVDELLELTESKVVNAYKKAPTTIRVALLQYLCDIPAFGKVLHVSSQAALRGCPYCKEEGVYCKSLHKVIHVNNRSFLPPDHRLRKDEKQFASKKKENDSKPPTYTKEEEVNIRERYDSLPNNNQKTALQKETGLKGKYCFMRLPYHERRTQMQPDGMHTIADLIGNILAMISGKDDGKKVRNGEEEYGRFRETWVQKSSEPIVEPVETTKSKKRKRSNQENQGSKKRKTQETMEDELPLPPAPWRLDKKGLTMADTRAENLLYPSGYDYHPDKHFTKPWTLRTMHGKHQFISCRAALWCLRGLLPIRQERTLQKLFDVIKKLTCEEYQQDELEMLIEKTSEAVALLERDFPLALQTITTHLLHHIPEGFADFGPLYGRWLFPFERVNSWITRQALNKNKIEATIMETYAIYDWCVYMTMSGIVNMDNMDLGTLNKFLVDEPVQDKSTRTRDCEIPQQILEEMSDIYEFALIRRMRPEATECRVKSQTYGNTERKMKYAVKSNGRAANNYVYVFKDMRSLQCSQSVSSEAEILFGSISKIFDHSFRNETQTWVILDIFLDNKYEDGFWSVKDQQVGQKPFLLKDISFPQVVGKENGRMYFVSTDVRMC